MVHPGRTRVGAAVAVGASLTLALAACSKSDGGSGGSSAAAPSASAQGAQVAATPTAAGGTGCTIGAEGFTKLDLKGATVGFSQSEKEANPFRIAETQSIKDEAAKLGIKVITTNAQSQLQKQISDIQDLLARGAKALIVAPLNSDGLQPAFAAAKAKGVPIITIDRQVTTDPCTDHVTFIGSNFVEQGHRAAKELITATGGKGNVAILLGSSGNNVTTDRTKGFKDELAASAPGLKIVAEQTGDFTREEGQSVTEQLLQAHPDITAVYGENDEMALGAVVAIKAAGKNPGKDVKVVSVDGTRNAVQQIVKGSMNAVIESNPRFGPLAFSTLTDFEAGKAIPAKVIITDRQYDSSNAAASVAGAY